MILDPLKPERIDHIAIAVGCLVVTLAAIVYDGDQRAAVSPLTPIASSLDSRVRVD